MFPVECRAALDVRVQGERCPNPKSDTDGIEALQVRGWKGRGLETCVKHGRARFPGMKRRKLKPEWREAGADHSSKNLEGEVRNGNTYSRYDQGEDAVLTREEFLPRLHLGMNLDSDNDLPAWPSGVTAGGVVGESRM